MRNRVVCAVGAAFLTLVPGVARTEEGHAPPMLTPGVAAAVAAGCPGTRPYAEALVRGITDADAAVAAPKFAACAKPVRLFENQWKNDAANVALGAVELSRGLLQHDAGLLRRAADATEELRSKAHVTDAVVRTWPVIPDFVDIRTGVVYADCLGGSIAINAAYVNVAARAGTAWVATPRDTKGCTLTAATGPWDPFAAVPSSGRSAARPEYIGDQGVTGVREPNVP
jgi:hypothetical protein